jgi:hypothetical protein
MPIAFTRPQVWQKRSVLFGSLAMLIGAVVALDLTPAPALYRIALGLDMVIVSALAVLFFRLTRSGLFAQ